jgi:hypothetical protein
MAAGESPVSGGWTRRVNPLSIPAVSRTGKASPTRATKTSLSVDGRTPKPGVG